VHVIEALARKGKHMLGLADDSRIVSAVRPAYVALLEGLYGRSGLLRTIHGEEQIRLRPRDRLIPENYEPSVFEFLKRKIKPGDVIIDVGAHVGIVTMIMARWVGESGHIHAFEPNPVAREALNDHLQLNELADRVTVNSCALGDRIGRTTFYSVGTSGISSLSDAYVDETAVQIEVPIETLDSYCRSMNIKPTLIKIDVEGFEFSVLNGARKTLLEYQPSVLVEFHPMNWPGLDISPAWAKAQLADLRYKVSAMDGQQDIFSDYGHVLLEPDAVLVNHGESTL